MVKQKLVIAIPEEFFKAVAEILAFVYRTNKYRALESVNIESYVSD